MPIGTYKSVIAFLVEDPETYAVPEAPKNENCVNWDVLVPIKLVPLPLKPAPRSTIPLAGIITASLTL